MDAVKIRCRDLMIRDWITNESGLPTQIITVSGACAYAIFGGDEGDPWVFDDYIYLPTPIPLTPEILEKNGFVLDCGFWTIANPRYNNVIMVTYYSIGDDVADTFLGHWVFNENYAIDYVHQLQHALRLCGLNELADNFKI